MRSFPFMLIFLIPLSVFTGYLLGGFYTFLTPLIVFGIVPILDQVIGVQTSNIDQELVQEYSDKKSYRIITWLCAIFQVITVISGIYLVSLGNLDWIELIGFTISMGISSGVMGINVAHELAHRINNKFEPFLSKIMLMTTLYMHWGLEHVVGHHRDVATPLDPATARKDQSFYSFFPQTLFGGIKKIWHFESNRLKKRKISRFNIKNRVIQFFFIELFFIAGVYSLFGFLAMIILIIHSILAILDLELINYIEHYGLERELLPNGKYERVKPIHSWNSSHLLTNWFLFNLQRHSDHHYKPGKRYQVLNHYDESPQLPSGYATMLMLAMIPFLWKKIINPKL